MYNADNISNKSLLA